MDDALRIFLPILWCAVATIVALILYKSSTAYLEAQYPSTGIQKLTLTGSAVIAVVVFVGLWKTTPASLIAPPGSVVIETSTLRDVIEAADAVSRDAKTAHGCANNLVPVCDTYFSSLELDTKRLEDASNPLRTTISPPVKGRQ